MQLDELIEYVESLKTDIQLVLMKYNELTQALQSVSSNPVENITPVSAEIGPTNIIPFKRPNP